MRKTYARLSWTHVLNILSGKCEDNEEVNRHEEDNEINKLPVKKKKEDNEIKLLKLKKASEMKSGTLSFGRYSSCYRLGQVYPWVKEISLLFFCQVFC